MTWRTTPLRVGLIGHPVAHSVSPRFQQAAFDALGIAARYEPWDVAAADLPRVIAALRAPDALGANVTIPYKEAALQHVDRLDQTARHVGAINTIVRGVDGLLDGYNTDVAGFQASLARARFDPRGREAVLWGAGGAARAVACALIWRGIGRLTILNRTALRAGRLRHDLAAFAGDTVLRAHGQAEPAAPQALAAAHLIVQCTPIGLRGGGAEDCLPFPLANTRPDAMIVDLVANPVETALVRAALASGRPAIGGLPMLVYQGAASFELWTRTTPPLHTMFSVARAAMAAIAAASPAPGAAAGGVRA